MDTAKAKLIDKIIDDLSKGNRLKKGKIIDSLGEELSHPDAASLVQLCCAYGILEEQEGYTAVVLGRNGHDIIQKHGGKSLAFFEAQDRIKDKEVRLLDARLKHTERINKFFYWSVGLGVVGGILGILSFLDQIGLFKIQGC